MRQILESRHNTSLRGRFLEVLALHDFSDLPLTEVRYMLGAERPPRTVKGAARHADKDTTTLRRHWKSICPARPLRDLNRLIELVRLAETPGRAVARAAALGIDIRTLRAASLALTGKPLRELLVDPMTIIHVLERWLDADVRSLH